MESRAPSPGGAHTPMLPGRVCGTGASEATGHVGGMPCHPSHRRRASRTAPTTAQSRFAAAGEACRSKTEFFLGLHRRNDFDLKRKKGEGLQRILFLSQRLPFLDKSQTLERLNDALTRQIAWQLHASCNTRSLSKCRLTSRGADRPEK